MLQVPTIIVVFYITISRFFRSLPFETFVICLMVGINFNINSQDNKACNIWVTVIVGTCNVRGYCQYLTNIFFFLEKTWFRLEYLQNIILNDYWHVSFCMTTTTNKYKNGINYCLWFYWSWLYWVCEMFSSSWYSAQFSSHSLMYIVDGFTCSELLHVPSACVSRFSWLFCSLQALFLSCLFVVKEQYTT